MMKTGDAKPERVRASVVVHFLCTEIGRAFVSDLPAAPPREWAAFDATVDVPAGPALFLIVAMPPFQEPRPPKRMLGPKVTSAAFLREEAPEPALV